MPIHSGKIIKIYQRCGLHSQDSLDLGEPYPTTPHDLKSVLWFNSYSNFSSKLVLKPRGVDLKKKIKKTICCHKN